MKHLVVLSTLLLPLASCNQPVQPSANDAEIVDSGNAAAPSAAAHLPDDTPPPAGGAAAWLVGHWAFGEDCASDFTVQYNADSTVDNSGETGTWKLDGGKITETITEKFEMGDEAPKKVDPPMVRSFPVERVDHNHGVVTSPFNGKKVPILRC